MGGLAPDELLELLELGGGGAPPPPLLPEDEDEDELLVLSSLSFEMASALSVSTLALKAARGLVTGSPVANV